MMNTNSKILTGIIAGALAGLTVGILFAPKNGHQTRSLLAGKANELADTLKHSVRRRRLQSRKIREEDVPVA